MTTGMKRLVLFLLAGACAWAQSTVWDIWNGASGIVENRFSASPGSNPIAAGSLVQAGVWLASSPKLDPAAVTLALLFPCCMLLRTVPY